MKRILLALAILCGAIVQANAQASVSLYCWNPAGSNATNNQWEPCQSAYPLSVTGTITPSGTQNINITQILGAAPSLTNPLFVSPATGATFPVSGTVTATPGSQYPSGAVPLTTTATGTTAATVATLAGTAGKTTYICGFTISADATTALAGAATVTGTISGSLNYIQNVGAATAAGVLTQTFSPCIPASAANTAIVITSAAAGIAGNTSVNGWGYQL
jgi:predicted porin